MLTSEETILQEVARVLTDASFDDIDVLTALENIKAREKAKRVEKQRQAMERAMQSTYRIAQVERATVYDAQTGQARNADKITGGYIVQFRDLPAFAQAHGLEYDTLKAAVENRAKQATNKHGQAFQLYPLLWTDQPDRTAELEEDAREAVRESAYIRKVNEGRAKARRENADAPKFLQFTIGKK